MYHRRKKHPVNLQCSFIHVFVSAGFVCFCVTICVCEWQPQLLMCSGWEAGCHLVVPWGRSSATQRCWELNRYPVWQLQLISSPQNCNEQQTAGHQTLHNLRPPTNSGKTVRNIYFLSLSTWYTTDCVSAYNLCPSNTSMLLTKHFILNNHVLWWLLAAESGSIMSPSL